MRRESLTMELRKLKRISYKGEKKGYTPLLTRGQECDII